MKLSEHFGSQTVNILFPIITSQYFTEDKLNGDKATSMYV